MGNVFDQKEAVRMRVEKPVIRASGDFFGHNQKVVRMPFWKPEKCFMPIVEIGHLGCRVRRGSPNEFWDARKTHTAYGSHHHWLLGL